MVTKKCIHVFFSGLVQGVGFRFTAQHLAQIYRIKGWVKNLFDGRVELVAEGAPSDVEAFLSALREEFKRTISDVQTEEINTCQDYKDFQIRF